MFKTLETRIFAHICLVEFGFKDIVHWLHNSCRFRSIHQTILLEFHVFWIIWKKKENNYYWSLNLFGTFMSSVFYYRLPVGRKVTFFNTLPSNLMISESKRVEEFSEAEAEGMTSKLN